MLTSEEFTWYAIELLGGIFIVLALVAYGFSRWEKKKRRRGFRSMKSPAQRARDRDRNRDTPPSRRSRSGFKR